MFPGARFASVISLLSSRYRPDGKFPSVPGERLHIKYIFPIHRRLLLLPIVLMMPHHYKEYLKSLCPKAPPSRPPCWHNAVFFVADFSLKVNSVPMMDAFERLGHFVRFLFLGLSTIELLFFLALSSSCEIQMLQTIIWRLANNHHVINLQIGDRR